MAQPADRPCAEDAAPADNYQSQGVGLTVPELSGYGPNEVGQGSIYFELDGVQLHKVDCDLRLATRTSSRDTAGNRPLGTWWRSAVEANTCGVVSPGKASEHG